MKESDIQHCLSTLKEGGLILYPTETIWGLGCDATNPEAVAKIYGLKGREASRSMLILVDSPGMLMRHVKEVPEISWQLVEVSEDPMTIIYPGAKNIAPELIAPDGSVGIRITTDPFCRKLISVFRKPLVSTSANFSGKEAPAWFGEIDKKLISKVDYVVEHRRGDQKKGKPSSIIKVGLSGEVSIIRK